MIKQVAIGIDIGGTNTAYGIVDKNGALISQASVPTRQDPDFSAFFNELSDQLLNDLEILGSDVKLAGIGIGAPNGNYFSGKIESAPNLAWEGDIDLVKEIQKHISTPVVVTNDANAAAMGEMIFGSAKGMQDFILITIGTGLGGGIVSNGKLLYGHDGFAGELGHTRAVSEGRPCNCGKNGCLEAYVSARGIVETVIGLIEENHRVSSLKGVDYGDLSPKVIKQAAEKGDVIALRAYEKTGEILGGKLADFALVTSPEAIFILGGIANAGDILLKPTLKYFNENLLPTFRGKIPIRLSGLNGQNAGILGSAALLWKELESQTIVS